MVYIQLFIQLAVILIPFMVIVFILTWLGSEVYIKRTIRKGTLFYMWGADRLATYKLINTHGAGVVDIEGKKYKLDPKSQGSIMFPFWAPTVLQERIPVFYILLDDPITVNPHEPTAAIDPNSLSSEEMRLMTSKMFYDVNDQNMMEAMAREAREAAEGEEKSKTLGVVVLMVASFITLLLVGVMTYLVIQLGSSVNELVTLVKG